MQKRDIKFIMDGNFIYHDKKVYSPHMHYEAFASRYSKGFNKVEIFSRAFEKDSPVGFEVAQNNVVFNRAPTARGLKNYLLNIFKIFSAVFANVKQADILMLRFPGNLAIIAMIFCLLINKKFCVEVVAEPKDYFTKENGFGRFYFIYRFIHCNATKYAVKRAVIVRYVTSQYLQQSYPADPNKAFGFTDVYLGNLGSDKKSISADNFSHRIINVAMMHNDSKGHIQLIQACALLRDRGVHVQVDFVGDGIRRPYYESLVNELQLNDLINFAGIVAGGEQLTKKLLSADLFVLPSSQEGMPRSLLEAMFLHLPCLATNVGGIPELLPESAIIYPNDAVGLADKIEHLFVNLNHLMDLQQSIISSIQKIDEKELSKLYDHYISALNELG